MGSGWRRVDWFGDYRPMGTDGWLWYNGRKNPRWFFNMATGQWESWQ